ncbi:hypothetical protein GGR58DRAFT_475017 [Xylaria digitata]|nr:hypothetical protein GGR58DRAFT_475017 [Xylaria digitata]
MASSEPEFLAAFGESDFFRTAFKYNLDNIKEWMEDCCTGKKGGSRTEDSKIQELLDEVYKRFSRLIVPEGPDFLQPEPKSHFLRKLDPNWNSEDQNNTVRFNLRRWGYNRWGYPDKVISVEWWNPYDLLGLFLSILGPAPPGADKLNYFLPLTALYAQWCSRIAGKDEPGKVGVGFLPAVYQATWKRRDPVPNDKFDYFLGSSVAGDNWEANQVGQWRLRVQQARFNMFHSSLRIKLFEKADFDEQSSPEQKNRPNGQPFGNCAETYPFIFSSRSAPENNKNLGGIALKSSLINKGTSPIYNHNKVSKAQVGPCLNCQQLITNSGALQENFQVLKGPKPAQEMAKETVPTEELETRATAQPSAVVDPPEGWSNDPDELDADFYWGPDGDGRAAAGKVGLVNPTGQIIVSRYNGGDAYIFTTPDNKVYLWNMITHEVYEFTNPTRLEDILAQLKLPPGQGRLERKLLHDAV